MSKSGHPSIWSVLRSWLPSGAPPPRASPGASKDEASANQATPVQNATPPHEELSDATGEEEHEEPLAEPGSKRENVFEASELNDRVVVMLLFDQVVNIEQVSAAWHRWQNEHAETPQALWRTVARLPKVDSEAAYRRAARTYSFESLDFNMHRARSLIRKHRGRFTREQLKRMVTLNVAPVRIEYDAEQEAKRWMFATHDPARPPVRRLLATLNVAHHALFYAPQEPLEEVFDEALSRLAKERTERRFCTDMSQERTPREKDVAFLKDLSSLSYRVEQLLREHKNENAHARRPSISKKHQLENLTKRSSPSSTRSNTRSSNSAQPERADTLTPRDVFDAALTEAVQRGARAVYLLDSGDKELAVYYRQGRRLRGRKVETPFSADAVIDFITGRILSLRRTETRMDATEEHWDRNGCTKFWLSVAQPHELAEVLPAAPETDIAVAERTS